tara:strand:- start:108 stop:503 length:396 start_codon:yes stop_codon:yes gene_type:complete
MSSIRATTDWVVPDELCYNLSEVNVASGKAGEGWHRYRITTVVRMDRLADHWLDLGRVDRWKEVDLFRIPGGVMEDGKYVLLHTVNELVDIAELYWANKFEKFEPRKSTIVQRFFDRMDAVKDTRVGKKVM